MKHYVTRTWPAKIRKAWPIFSVLLLPALASEVGGSSIETVTEEDSIPIEKTESSRPYLQYVGPPALRFEDPAPPPDLSVRPASAAPPLPEHNSSSSAAKPAPEPTLVVDPAPTATAGKLETAPNHQTEITVAGANQPTSILPDDSKQRVRPEDFLPFFQFPGGHTAPDANASGTIPPSSATYKQQ